MRTLLHWRQVANGNRELGSCYGFGNDLQDHWIHVQLTIFQQPYQTLILAPASVSNVSALSKFPISMGTAQKLGHTITTYKIVFSCAESVMNSCVFLFLVLVLYLQSLFLQ